MQRTLFALVMLSTASLAHSATWTYRGNLNDAGRPANGQYDLRITLFDAAKTTRIGNPVTLYSVQVSDGNFAVDLDFGFDLISAPPLKIKTEVQHNNAGFNALGEPSHFDPKATLAGVCWDTEGNSGTNSATNFIGTIDAQPVIFRAQNQQVVKLENNPITIGNTANVLTGSTANSIDAGVRGATINGGGMAAGDSDPDFTDEGPNRITDSYGTIGGGFGNTAGEAGGTTTGTAYATVSGGSGNTASGVGSVIGGGRQQLASGSFTTVSGGNRNVATSIYASVGGGVNNAAIENSSTVSGGDNNCAGGEASWAGGTGAKVRVPMGTGSNPPGQGCDTITNTTDSDGDEGTFVWADTSPGIFQSSGANQFLVRADGGFGFNTSLFGGSVNDDMVIAAKKNSGNDNVDVRLSSRNDETTLLGVSDTTGSTYFITSPNSGEDRLRVSIAGALGGIASLSNGGTWTNASSRGFKENFSRVDSTKILNQLLAMPIMTWDYIGSNEGSHMGPVAEDFKASFGLAGNGKAISTVDADGVAMAAIQGLNQKLEAELAALKQALKILQAQMQQMSLHE